MKYNVDNFVFYEMDGCARILFQSKEFYIYIWIDEKLYINAIQLCRTDRDKNVEERLDSQGLLLFYNKEKLKTSITKKHVEIFTEVENDTFENMFKYLGGLTEGAEVEYKLNRIEYDHFNRMPKSKKYC
jgi:hypothetical protein